MLLRKKKKKVKDQICRQSCVNAWIFAAWKQTPRIKNFPYVRTSFRLQHVNGHCVFGKGSTTDSVIAFHWAPFLSDGKQCENGSAYFVSFLFFLWEIKMVVTFLQLRGKTHLNSICFVRVSSSAACNIRMWRFFLECHKTMHTNHFLNNAMDGEYCTVSCLSSLLHHHL